MCDVAQKMSIKITASKEQMFRLRDCSEDDTLIIERTGVSFGALVFEPFLLVAGAVFPFYF
jgi:hypothetical protein